MVEGYSAAEEEQIVEVLVLENYGISKVECGWGFPVHRSIHYDGVVGGGGGV